MDAYIHTHKEAGVFSHRGSGSGVFIPRSHSPEFLEALVTTKVKTRAPEHEKWLEDEFLTAARTNIRESSLENGFTVPDEDVLKFYLRYFDDIFFCGSLKSRCTLDLQEYPEGLPDKKDVPQKYTVRAFDMESGNVKSWIVIHTLSAIYDRKERLTAYLGILLHEMSM